MVPDSHGALRCLYCGGESYFSDSDLSSYKTMRADLLQYVKNLADVRADEADYSYLRGLGQTEYFITDSGKTVSVDYYFYTEEDNVCIYSAFDSVVFVFPENGAATVEDMKRGISLLCYPSADIKDLSRYFPHIRAEFTLNDGRVFVAVSKPENAFPLYAFKNLDGEHVAWIISRLENLCCVLEFSSLRHNGISTSSVYINPRTHEAYLLGGWWKSKPAKTFYNGDLVDLRRTGKIILGSKYDAQHSAFKSFLCELPREDAYNDFSNWDNVINKAFGGHRFVEFKSE